MDEQGMEGTGGIVPYQVVLYVQGTHTQICGENPRTQHEEGRRSSHSLRVQIIQPLTGCTLIFFLHMDRWSALWYFPSRLVYQPTRESAFIGIRFLCHINHMLDATEYPYSLKLFCVRSIVIVPYQTILSGEAFAPSDRKKQWSRSATASVHKCTP